MADDTVKGKSKPQPAAADAVEDGLDARVAWLKDACPTRRSIELDALLAGVTPENVHPEVDWGPPVGREFPNEE